MMFGLLMIPLLIGAGIGLDMMRAGQMRAKLAEAADSGLLAAARAMMSDGTLTETEAETLARKYFDGNGQFGADISIDTFDFENDTVDELFRLTVTGRMKTTILGITGQKYMPINIKTEANIAPPRALEVALVLDNTYSMTGSKLTTLKDAAEDLVDTIMEDTDNEVKVGLVPFSQYVNIGLSRRDETWLDVDDDSSTTTTEEKCWNTYPDSTESCTVTSTYDCSYTRDGVTVSRTCNNKSCTGSKGAPVRVCEDRTSTSTETWNGCVGSRNYPFNVKDEQYDARAVPGLMNVWCTQELLPLTLNKTTVINNIQSMSVQGNQTYIPAGLSWGYRLLSNIEPFSEGISYAEQQSEHGVKAIVLMTDGVNTRSAQYPWHTASGAIGADRILEELCVEAKGKGITIYTIAFEVLDSKVRDLLQDCATSTGHYFNANDSAALVDAFDSIGNSLIELALTK